MSPLILINFQIIDFNYSIILPTNISKYSPVSKINPKGQRWPICSLRACGYHHSRMRLAVLFTQTTILIFFVYILEKKMFLLYIYIKGIEYRLQINKQKYIIN